MEDGDLWELLEAFLHKALQKERILYSTSFRLAIH